MIHEEVTPPSFSDTGNRHVRGKTFDLTHAHSGSETADFAVADEQHANSAVRGMAKVSELAPISFLM